MSSEIIQQKINKIKNETEFEGISPEDVSEPMTLLNKEKASKESLSAVSTGFRFKINPSTPVPEGGWKIGIYPAEISGVYPNQNNIVVDLNDGFIGLVFDEESNWSSMTLPLDSQLIEKSNPIVGGVSDYGVKIQLLNSSNADPNLYHYVKNIPSPNYGILEKIFIYIHSSSVFNTLDVLVLSYNGKEFAEKYHETINVAIGANDIDINLPIEKGDYVGIRTQGTVFTYDNTLDLQDFSAYNGVNPYLQSNFNLGFGFEINFNPITQRIFNRQSGISTERIRPIFNYNFGNRFPIGIEDVGGNAYAITAGGLLMSATDYNDDSKYLKVKDILLDYREYTLQSDFKIISSNISVIIGTTGANSEGTGEGGNAYAITAEFTYLTPTKSGLTIKREGVNAVISVVQLDCSVGDLIEFKFIHFYDRFIATVNNKTKGLSDSISLVLNTAGPSNEGDMKDIVPIYARPKFQFKLGQIELQNLDVKLFDSEKNLRTLILGDSIATCSYSDGYVNCWQFKTFVKNNFTTISGPGYQTSNFINNLDAIGILNPQYLLISLGTNDLLNGVSVSIFRQNLQKIIDYCKNRQIMPYLMTVGRLPISNTDYVNAVKDLGTQNRIKVIDISTILSSGDMHWDGVHPINHQKIAEKIKLEAIELL